jgi:hypothetical protein
VSVDIIDTTKPVDQRTPADPITSTVQLTETPSASVSSTSAGRPSEGRLSDPGFRARVLTPVLFVAMILLPASVLVAAALFGSDGSVPAAATSGQVETVAGVGG